MGILSSTVSITRYRVQGKPADPLLEVVTAALQEHVIREIEEGDDAERAVGWTSFAAPFQPDFEGSNIAVGANLAFSLRIDRKNTPAKVVKKQFEAEIMKRLAQEGRETFSRTERQAIREEVERDLLRRIPAVPDVYDLIWSPEEGWLWFFSNQKRANEEFETLFVKSFNLQVIRLFPYTLAELNIGLTDSERDALNSLTPGRYAEQPHD